MKQYLLKLWMTVALSLLVVGGVWGQAVTYSPSIGATDVSVSPELSIEFDGEVTIGSGNIYVYEEDIEGYFFTIPTMVQVGRPPVTESILNPILNLDEVNNILSIDLAGQTLPNSTVIYITIEVTAISVDGEPWDELDTWDPMPTWSFTTTAPPTSLTASLTPADDAPNVPVSTSIFEITFSENVELAGGTVLVELYQSGTVVGSTGLYSSNISNKVVSLSFNHTLSYEKEYEIVFPANAIKSVATGALFPGLSAGEWTFATEAAPFTLDLQVPEDGAIDVALDANLVATFNQDIQLGSGAEVHIYGYQSELVVEAITTELSVSGSDLIINPTADLAEGTHYYVVIPAGAVETTSGEPFAGLTDKDAWDFTTVYLPLESPVLSPAHNADGVLKDAVLSLQFDKDIELGSGTIAIYTSSGQEKLFDASSPSVSIVNNNKLQIDLSSNPLPEYETVYDVRIASTLIKRDGSEVYFAGFGAGEWSFTTEAEPDPLLMDTSSLSPADGADEVPRAPTLEVSFNQAITWGLSGVLTIHRYDNDATVATISPGETGATISQDKLSIIFSSDRLEYGTKYYVIIDEGFVKALNTSAVFPGLSDKDVWTFTTETAPPFWAEEGGYPMIANQTAADFDLLGKVDQDGTYYFVVSDEDSMLTYDEISTAATSGGTGRFLAAGNDVVVADIEFEATISTADLEPGFNYYLFVYTSNGDKNGEIVRLTIDRTAPRLRTTETFPSAGYSVLPIDADIVLTFSEKIYGVDEEGVLVELTTANAGSFIKLVTGETSVTTGISVSEDGRVFTLSPTDYLSENTSYSVEFSELYDAQFNVATISAHTFSTDKLNVWIGGYGASFSDDRNWSGGEFVAGKSVRIPKYEGVDYPVFDVTDDVEVNNLTIEAGAMLDQKSGSLKINGVFTLESSSDYNATYIPGGTLTVVGDSVRIEQVIPSGSVSYMISSPTDNATISNIGTTGPLYYYDNATDAWVLHGSGPMNAGAGYLTWTSVSPLVFSGNINNTTVVVPVSYTPGKGYGWNLVGNPFTAGLDWSSLPIPEDIENNIWIWQPKEKVYGSLSGASSVFINLGSPIIPSNHAFLVRMSEPLGGGSGQSSFNITPDALVSQAQVTSYLKSSSTPNVEFFKFAGVNGELMDETAVAFVEDATFAKDKYDAQKYFSGESAVLELFTLIGSVRTGINVMPFVNEHELALGYRAASAGEYSIRFVDSDVENKFVVLLDKTEGIEIDFREVNEYSFTISQGGYNTTRFALRFVSTEPDAVTSLSPASVDCFGVEAYSDNGSIFLSVNGALDTYTYRLFNTQGRMLRTNSIQTGRAVTLGAYTPGIYIVEVLDVDLGNSSKKKVVVY